MCCKRVLAFLFLSTWWSLWLSPFGTEGTRLAHTQQETDSSLGSELTNFVFRVTEEHSGSHLAAHTFLPTHAPSPALGSPPDHDLSNWTAWSCVSTNCMPFSQPPWASVFWAVKCGEYNSPNNGAVIKAYDIVYVTGCCKFRISYCIYWYFAFSVSKGLLKP